MRQNGSELSGGQMQINSWLGFAEREESKTKTALPAGAKRSEGYIQFPAGDSREAAQGTQSLVCSAATQTALAFASQGRASQSAGYMVTDHV